MNINNSDVKNEQLFWKVFHNMVLFKNIINKIKYEKEKFVYNELVVNYKNYKAREMHKFKYITSLDWMIKNREYQLLKCKLIANEYIDINLKSLESFINIISKSSMDVGHLSTIEKQLIVLLFKTKKIQCKGFIDDILYFLVSKLGLNSDYLKITIDFKNNGIKEMFKIFLNDLSYPIPIYPSTLEFIIENQNDNYSLRVLLELILNSSSSTNLSFQSNEILNNNIKFKRFETNKNYNNSNNNNNNNNEYIMPNNNNSNDSNNNKIGYTDYISKILENHRLLIEQSTSDQLNKRLIAPIYFDSLLELSISKYKVYDIINLIENFINEINTLNHKQTSITINHLYQLLLNIGGIKLEEIRHVRLLLLDHEIIITHSVYHTFWYLAIKSPYLIRYLMKRETRAYSKKRKFEEHDHRNDYDRGSNLFFDTQIDIGKYRYNNGYFKNIGTNLIYQKLTFDFIFGNDDNDNNNFDTLLLELMNQCTHESFNIEKKSSVWSMSQDLFYLISDLNRKDLFEREIQFYLDNYYKGNEWTLWNTLVSNGFRCDLLLKQFDSQRFQSTFKKDDILSVSEIITWFHLIFSSGNVDAINAIFQNYYHFQGKYSFQFDSISLETVEYLFTHYFDFFIPSFDEISKSSENFFTKSFIRGDILMCDLFLKHFPNQFKITNDLITLAINSNKINIIKYYCENGTIKSNHQLDHLGNQLKDHMDYKFLN
ncbi:hypothetical protein RB653_003440 [Dictyostelium firmibasis]|uniref:Uncharacterized protein n=1 Tax=Dictyostelium firmibasis TaxID=79012 RepID=A0AAN7U4N7_9MYCE